MVAQNFSTSVIDPITEHMFCDVLQQLRADPQKYFGQPAMLTINPVTLVDGRHSQILKAKVIFGERAINICMKRVKLKGDSSKHHQLWQQRVETEYNVAKVIYDGFKRYSQDYSCVRPVGCFPKSLTLVTEECPGQPFMRLLENKARFYPDADTRETLARYCYLSGNWLRAFQELTKKSDSKFELDEMLEYVDRRLHRLVDHSAIPFDNRLRLGILAFIESQRSHISDIDRAISGVTGDFVPANVLVNDGKITVLDFGMFSYGSVYQDLAQYYQHMDFFRLKPIYRGVIISELQEEFLRGYHANWNKNKPLFTLFRIRCIVNRLAATTVRKWTGLPLHVRLFNRWAWPFQLNQLAKLCGA